MKRTTVVPILLFLLFASISVVIGNSKAYAGESNATSTGQVQLLWTNSMWVYDVAVSKDGNCIATVNDTGLHYFSSNSSNPQWWYTPAEQTFASIRLSYDGEYVVAGDRTGHIVYFNSSTSRTGEQTSPTWSSLSMGGAVERNTLDTSDDGNYVILGGTGVNFYYFSNCTVRSGASEHSTWSGYLGIWDFYAVRISPDGTCVAAGGSRYNGGFLAFYKNANTEPYPTAPAWYANNSIGG